MKIVYQYNRNNELLNKYKSIAEAGRAVGSSKETISACCNGKRNTAKGYVWSFDILEPKVNEDEKEYRDIKGYEGRYQITIDGEVRRLEYTDERGQVFPEKNIKSSIDCEGYHSVALNKKRVRVHRLIWEAFIGDIPDNMEIDHINRDRSDNRISNMRLVSRKENIFNRTLPYRPDIQDCSKYQKYKNKENAHPYLLRFTENGKRIRVGYFQTYEEAENEYNRLYKERQNRIDYVSS